MELKTYNVNVGSIFQFRPGDIVRVALKKGTTYYQGAGNDIVYSYEMDDEFAQGAIADPSVTSINLIGPRLLDDNATTIEFYPTFTFTLNPAGLTAENHDEPLNTVLTDPTKVEVLRWENTSAKLKTVVTKERLGYYTQKIKTLLATKGTVKKVAFGGTEYTPDANGTVALPDSIPEMRYDTMMEELALNFKTVNDQTQGTYDDNEFVFSNDAIDGNGITITLKKENVQQFSAFLPNKAYVDAMAAECSTLKFQKVNAVPSAATAQNGIIYLVENTSAGSNVYDEYFKVNKGTDQDPNYVMELFGTTAVDLTDYLQESDLLVITPQEIDQMFTPVTP